MTDLYQAAGVDISAGNQLVKDIKELVGKTRRPEVLADVGGFAGLFQLKKYQDPVLVASTDGVGTKILLAQKFKKWDGIGIDCVAMCVNDVACLGAEPLFFLDYLACGRIDRSILKAIVAGMAEACQQVGCALLGGETAEMPGLYSPEKFDVAGFAVGVVEKEKIINGASIQAGDSVIGVASSGFHSNGYSLIRKIIEGQRWNLTIPCAETGLSLAETLLVPTRLYPPLIAQLLKKEITIKGIAHITGGGLIENPPRILPKGLKIVWRKKSWPVPEYMRSMQKAAALSEEEFLRVFNGGIGLVLVVDPAEQEKTVQAIARLGEKAWVIGEVQK